MAISKLQEIKNELARIRGGAVAQAGGIVNTPKITYSKTDTQDEDKNRGRLLGGLGYLGHKLGLGVVQGVEGISDFIVGGVADLFGADEFADNIMKNDWTNYSAAEEWFNPGEGWQFAGDVAQGVGGMLPAIAVTAGITVASGGTAVPLAAQIAGSTVFGLQAAGQSTSEAVKESGTAGGKEWLYGIGSGALEAGIEALSGGIGGTQAGKVIGKKVGKSTLGKIATSFVGEGVEEVISDIANPGLKRITGIDKEAKVDWGNIPRTFLVGGATGAVMGGAGRVVNAAKAGGFNNLNAAENAQQLNERLADNNVRQAEGKKLTYTQEDINASRERLSKNLQKMSADKRQSFIEQNNLGNVFNEDGSAKPITLAPDSYNTDSYSASLKGREGSFVFKPVLMDSEASTAAKKAMNALTKLTKGDVNIVLTEDAITTESGAKANGLYKDGIIYLDAKADNYEQIKIVGAHEVIHSLEGTKAYNALANYVAETISKEPALQRKYGYEKYRAVYDSILEGDWTETTKDYQAMTEIFADYIANEVLVNEDSLRRVTNRDANILVKLYEWVRDSIKRLGNTESELESKRSLRKMERLLSKALNESRGGVSLETIEKNAREAERTKEQEKTAVKTTGKLATARFSVDLSFAEQVDAVLGGKDTESSHLQVRANTPKILLDVGLSDKPMLITSVHTKTAVGEEVKNKN
ncbi:MAG: hypothetical protein IIX02_07380, partial [Clostridia bacterium]|nr:hypothetical protein [Clostridia bacterium]